MAQGSQEELLKKGHNSIDLAEHEIGWSPYTEIVEIDKSDVVVANLWFGTTVYPLLEPPVRLSYTFQFNFPHI